ncbi:MAG: hypothetical protein ACXABY_37335 [Candidatus Thorarchaeota archaeon]|jgi:hypothetical protein
MNNITMILGMIALGVATAIGTMIGSAIGLALGELTFPIFDELVFTVSGWKEDLARKWRKR